MCLQRLVESYNMIFLLQFEGYYKNNEVIEQDYANKEKHLEDLNAQFEHNKAEFYAQKAMVGKLLESKDTMISEMTQTIAQLTSEIDELKNFLENSKTKSPSKEFDEFTKKQRQQQLKEIASTSSLSQNNAYSLKSSISEADRRERNRGFEQLDQNRSDFQKVMDELNIVNHYRTNNLNNLNKLVTRLLNAGNVHVAVQTEPTQECSNISNRQRVEQANQ